MLFFSTGKSARMARSTDKREIRVTQRRQFFWSKGLRCWLCEFGSRCVFELAASRPVWRGQAELELQVFNVVTTPRAPLGFGPPRILWTTNIELRPLTQGTTALGQCWLPTWANYDDARRYYYRVRDPADRTAE